MKRVTVPSTSIVSLGYDEKLRRLEVEFAGGGIYQYLGVPPHAVLALLESDSLGTHLNQRIKPRYRYRKVG